MALARMPLDHGLGRFARLARKELRETLRDRRTILTLVLMPLFVYPLLGLTFEKFLLSQATQGNLGEGVSYLIAFESDEDEARFQQLVETTKAVSIRRDLGSDVERPDWLTDPHWPEDVDLESLVARGLADVGIHWTDTGGTTENISLVFDASSPRGQAARQALENLVSGLNAQRYQTKLRRAGESAAPRFTINNVSVESTFEATTTVATVIPFILLLMTATGAVYPAIDLTAGERERGTLEALIAAPVSRRAVLGAKYVAVLCVATLTAAMNLIAMTATAFSLGLERFLFHEGLTAGAVLQVIALVLVMAAFFSAVVLLVTSFARSFKEAQAYLIPLMMLSLAPGVVSLMPELELTVPLAVTPLVGIVLLARDVLTEGTTGLLIVACVGSTMLYAGVALLLAARVFGTEALLHGSGGTWREMLQRPPAIGGVPPTTVAMASLAAVFPMFLLLGPLPARWEELGVAGQLAANGILTVLMFLVVPSAATILCRANWRLTYLMRRAPLAGWLGAAILGISLWPFAFELEMFILSSERVELLEELFAPIRAQLEAVPLGLKLVTLALIPAICEEWFFRGFFMSSLRTRLGDLASVAVAALLFGLFHVVVRDGLFLERMFPTAFLGFILGWVCVATGSLWPGMLLHAIHNGLIISLASFEEELSAWGWSGGERSHLPASWLVAAGVAVIVGGGLVEIVRRRSPRTLMEEEGAISESRVSSS